MVIVCIWLINALPATGEIFFEYLKLHGIAFWLFSALITFSLLVSVFSYVKIFKTLRYRQVQVHGNTQQGQRPNGGGNQLNIARYKKTVYSIAWVQLALLICYFPYILIRWLSVKPSYSTEIYFGIIRDSHLFKFFFKPSSLLLEDQRRQTRSEEHHPQDFPLLLKLITIKKGTVKVSLFFCRYQSLYILWDPCKVRQYLK